MVINWVFCFFSGEINLEDNLDTNLRSVASKILILSHSIITDTEKDRENKFLERICR